MKNELFAVMVVVACAVAIVSFLALMMGGDTPQKRIAEACRASGGVAVQEWPNGNPVCIQPKE